MRCVGEVLTQTHFGAVDLAACPQCDLMLIGGAA
jgi:hypothetical protein